MDDLILTALMVWIVTHTIAREIPLTANGPKPFSCQLCLSGWLCIAMGVLGVTTGGLPMYDAITGAGGLWGLSVLIEAAWMRLNTFIG